MEVIIFIGLVVVALAIFYHWNKKDVPADVVKTEQAPVNEEVPYKVEAPIPPEVAPVVAQLTETIKAAPAKKAAAKKTAAAKKPAAKKKLA
jgi:hypothetical protein